MIYDDIKLRRPQGGDSMHSLAEEINVIDLINTPVDQDNINNKENMRHSARVFLLGLDNKDFLPKDHSRIKYCRL